jgi:hypothetical protein
MLWVVTTPRYWNQWRYPRFQQYTPPPLPKKAGATLALKDRGCTRRSFKARNVGFSLKYRMLESRRLYPSSVQLTPVFTLQLRRGRYTEPRSTSNTRLTGLNYCIARTSHICDLGNQRKQIRYSKFWNTGSRQQSGGQVEHQDIKMSGNENCFK